MEKERKRRGTRGVSFPIASLPFRLQSNERTHSEVGVDVSLDDSCNLGLKLLHQGSSELGGSLSSRVGLCEREGKGRVSSSSTRRGSFIGGREGMRYVPVEGSISVRMYSIGSSSNISSS